MIGSLSTKTPSQSKMASSKRFAVIRALLLTVCKVRIFPDLTTVLLPPARGRSQPDFLWQLLGDPEQRLAAIHLGPDIRGGDPEFTPQHEEIIDQIDALVDYRRAFP